MEARPEDLPGTVASSFLDLETMQIVEERLHPIAVMVFTSSTEELPIPNKDLLSWIFDDQKYDPDKPIYIDAADPKRHITSRQALSLIRKLGRGLKESGLQQGDCVCVHSFNDIYYSILVLGIIAAGGTFAATNPSYTTGELNHHVRTCNTKFFLTEPEMLPAVVESAKQCHIPLSHVWVFDHHQNQEVPKGFKSWKDLLRHGESDWVRFDDEKLAKETPAALLHSSGTTGPPKSAVISHRNLISQHTLVFESVEKPYEVRRLIALPVFHVGAGPMTHTTALRSGHQTFIMRRFKTEAFLKTIQDQKITEFILVPPMVVAIIKSGLNQKYSMASVKFAIAGAAPLATPTQVAFQKLLPPDAGFTQIFGMTELTCIGTMFYWPENDNTGSVGRLLPGLKIKLLDEEEKEITDYNVHGELCFRGPTVFSGYLKDPKANTSAFHLDGWFKSGDIGYCDKKSKLWYIVDRKKELIKVRGFQVAPPELEAVLLSHAEISDAAVVGIPSPEAGTELPRAYVVLRHGSALTAEEIYDHSAQRLAKYKRLDGGVVLVDSIPKTPSGKILKRLLRDKAKARL